jgi:hypothetical protein
MPTYIQHHQQQTGPFDDAAVLAGLRDGTYAPDALAWREGMAEWQPLRALYPSVPPAMPGQAPPPMSAPRLGDDAGLRFLLPVGRSPWAIAAGYLGLLSVVLVPAPFAVLVSIIAIRDVRKSRATPHPRHGLGRAIFGLVMGILFTILGLFVLMGSAFPR